MRLLPVALALVLSSACAPPQIAYIVSPSGPATTAKAPDCDFEVRATIPKDGYEEIATVVFGSRTLTTYRASRDPDEFKSAIRHDVCAIGGDAVVTQVDAQGTIVRGAVLRRR